MKKIKTVKKINGKSYEILNSPKYPAGVVSNKQAKDIQSAMNIYGFSIRSEKISNNKRRLYVNYDKVKLFDKKPIPIERKKRGKKNGNKKRKK